MITFRQYLESIEIDPESIMDVLQILDYTEEDPLLTAPQWRERRYKINKYLRVNLPAWFKDNSLHTRKQSPGLAFSGIIETQLKFIINTPNLDIKKMYDNFTDMKNWLDQNKEELSKFPIHRDKLIQANNFLEMAAELVKHLPNILERMISLDKHFQ